MEFKLLHTAWSGENINYDFIIYSVKAADITTFDGAEDFGIAFRTLIRGGLKKVIVDMEGLEFIDSLGIGMLINTAKILRAKKGDIVLINVSEVIEKIFRPVNLTRFIKIFRSEDEAVKYLKVFV